METLMLEKQLLLDFTSEDYIQTAIKKLSATQEGTLATSAYTSSKYEDDYILSADIAKTDTKQKKSIRKTTLLTSIKTNQKQNEERLARTIAKGKRSYETLNSFNQRVKKYENSPYRINGMDTVENYAVDLALELKERDEDVFELQVQLITSVMTVCMICDDLTEGLMHEIFSNGSKILSTLQDAEKISKSLSKIDFSYDYSKLELDDKLGASMLGGEIAEALEARWLVS